MITVTPGPAVNPDKLARTRLKVRRIICFLDGRRGRLFQTFGIAIPDVYGASVGGYNPRLVMGDKGSGGTYRSRGRFLMS